MGVITIIPTHRIGTGIENKILYVKLMAKRMTEKLVVFN